MSKVGSWGRWALSMSAAWRRICVLTGLRAMHATQDSANTTREKVRARIEHVIWSAESSIGSKIVRTIGRAMIGTDGRPFECAHRWKSVRRRYKGPRGRQPGVKTVADRDTLARALRSFAQLKAEIARIVRGGNSSNYLVSNKPWYDSQIKSRSPSGASLPHVKIVFVVLSDCLLFNI